MLNYITVVHQPALHESEQETKRLGHTAPYVASEIFNSEIKSVCRQFFYEGELAEQIDSDEEVECFDQKENLDLLWKLFKPCQEVPINPVLAGYLEKTVQALVIQHPKELFTALFTKDEGASALKDMISNLENQSIASIFERCLNVADSCIMQDLDKAMQVRSHCVHLLLIRILSDTELCIEIEVLD